MRRRYTCGTATWLHLAATPTFAVMVLATAAMPGTGMDMPRPPVNGTPVLDSMVVMYLLMGIFHAGPWLQMFLARRKRHETSDQRAKV